MSNPEPKQIDREEFIREVERLAGASRKEMLGHIEALWPYRSKGTDNSVRWLRRILGEKP